MPEQTVALLDRLSIEDDEVEELFKSYFSVDPPGGVPRGLVVQRLVERCTALDATREALVHGLLHEAGEHDFAEELDRRSLERRSILHELYRQSANVAPQDVLAAEPERIDALIRALQAHRRDDLGFERAVLEQVAEDPAAVARLGEAADEVADVLAHAPTHPTDRRLEHERRPLGRLVHAAVDRMRDRPDAGDPGENPTHPGH